MKRHILYHQRLVTFLPMLLSAFMCAASVSREVRAQDLIVPAQPAPPPMKYIPETVRAALSDARDVKARARVWMDEAEARLARAEQLTVAKEFNPATAELGIYHALVEDMFLSLKQTGESDGRTRDLFKKLELALYKHSARIESMRRSTPSEYTGNLLALLRDVRDLRTASLEAFYGNTVLREDE